MKQGADGSLVPTHKSRRIHDLAAPSLFCVQTRR
jgi:hypothetical protein